MDSSGQDHLLDQLSDDHQSFQFLDVSPPRLDDVIDHAEEPINNVVENNQVVENAVAHTVDSNPVPIDESVDGLFDFSPLHLQEGEENTQVIENPSDGLINPLSINEYVDDDFSNISPLNLQEGEENTQAVENPSDGLINPLSINESVDDDFFNFSPLNLQEGVEDTKVVESPSSGLIIPLSIDESIDDDFFNISPLNLQEGKEDTQVIKNPSDRLINPLSEDESVDDDLFDFSPLNLQEGEEDKQVVDNPSDGLFMPLSIDESIDDDFFDFSPLNLHEGEEDTQIENPSSDGLINPLSIGESIDLDLIGFDSSPPAPVQKAGEHASDQWSFDENMEFENALAELDPSSPDFFGELASRVPSKSVSQIKTHYENLVYDIDLIEAGKIELPDYLDDQRPGELEAADHGGEDGGEEVSSSKKPDKGKGSVATMKKNRRGSAWTEEEHKNFLKGLVEYGRGDWRSISRNHVVSRTPTQIASHAQKFYRRQKNPKKSSAGASTSADAAATSSTSPHPRRRRNSIHDIAKVVTPTTTITIPTSPPKPDTTPQQAAPLTNTSLSPLVSSTTTVSIPPLQSFDHEEVPIPPPINRHPTLPPWTISSGITTATTTLIPPQRPRGRPRRNFNPRVQTQLAPIIPRLPLMHHNSTLPSRITSSTAILTIPTSPKTEQSLHSTPVSSAPLTNTINAQSTSFPPLISTSTTVSIPPLQSIDGEKAPFLPLAQHHMTLPPWIIPSTITTTTTTLIPPRRPRGRPRLNFNPRAQTDQQRPPIPLPLMHHNVTLPLRKTTSPTTTTTTALLPPRPPRPNFNTPSTQQAAISPPMGRRNLTSFRPPTLPSTPRSTASIPSIIHHSNPPQTDHLHQRHELSPFPECINVDFPAVPLIRQNSDNIPPAEIIDHDHEPDFPPFPYSNVPFPPPLTSSTPAMDPPPFEQTQSFLSFYCSSTAVPPSTTTTVSTTTSDPSPSAIPSGGLPSSSSSHPPSENWFLPPN